MASFTGADAADTADAVNVEQRFHEMEQRFVTLREDHSLVVTERSKLREAMCIQIGEFHANMLSLPFNLNCSGKQGLVPNLQKFNKHFNHSLKRTQSRVKMVLPENGDISQMYKQPYLHL